MRLLILTDGIAPWVIGGMQKHSYHLARELAIQGNDITLAHCVYNKVNLPSQEEVKTHMGLSSAMNIEIQAFLFPKAATYPGHYLNESYQYSRELFLYYERELNTFDFIYAKGFTAWHFLKRKREGYTMPPVGVKYHGYEMFQKPANLKMRLQNYLLQGPVKWNSTHADFVFSYGGGISRLIEKIGVKRNKIIEIPTGVDSQWITTRALDRDSSIRKFCFVGRYERRKGIEEIHAALKTLPEQGFHFHFIGPIPQSARVNKRNVTYHGALNDSKRIQEILDDCDVLVAPSYSEGMPNVIMEAMARGLTVIATPVGAIESIISKDNGWLIEPGDSSSLAKLILEITELDVASLNIKKESSLTIVNQLTWDKIATRTILTLRKQLTKED